MSDSIEYPQQLFSVSDFREVVEQWPHWTFRHNEKSGNYTTEDEHRWCELFYRILGDDLLVMYQRFHFLLRHRSPVSPKEDDSFYLFYYVHRQNLPVIIHEDRVPSELQQGAIAFCNNQASPVIEYPEGHRGEDIQLIISENFIHEYINPGFLKNPVLQGVIDGTDNSFLVMPRAPAPIRRQMNRLVNDILMQPSKPMNKLHVLQKSTHILDLFFRMHLPPRDHAADEMSKKDQNGTRSSSKEDPFAPTEDGIRQVARYLDTMIHVPFPGLEFLAFKFDLSLSDLKRSFKKSTALHPSGITANSRCATPAGSCKTPCCPLQISPTGLALTIPAILYVRSRQKPERLRASSGGNKRIKQPGSPPQHGQCLIIGDVSAACRHSSLPNLDTRRKPQSTDESFFSPRCSIPIVDQLGSRYTGGISPGFRNLS